MILAFDDNELPALDAEAERAADWITTQEAKRVFLCVTDSGTLYSTDYGGQIQGCFRVAVVKMSKAKGLEVLSLASMFNTNHPLFQRFRSVVLHRAEEQRG